MTAEPTEAADLARTLARNLTLIEQSVAALGSAAMALEVLPGPATARAAVDVEQAWRRVEEEFGLLDAAEMGRRAGSRAKSLRGWASQKRRDHELVGVRRRNRFLYPGFLLDSAGRTRPAVRAAVTVLVESGWREDDVVLWFVTANGWLSGSRPVDLLDRDPGSVIAAARSAVDQW